MRHLSSSSLCATAAISAALALGSTSAFAQEATPTIVLPPPAASAPPPQPAASAPSIVLPPPAASAPEAVAEPAPAPRAERPAPRRAEAPARPAAEPAAAPRSAAATVPAPKAAAPATAAPAAAPMDVPVAAPAAAPAADAPQPDSVRRAVDVPDEIIAASILGVLGLGIAGFVATRRRRRDEVVYDAVYEAEPAHVADAPTTSIPDELALRPQDRVHAAVAPAGAAAFAMPEGPVPSGDARERLLAAMVAAEPDEANPFTSAKARRRRARIILQAREQEQRQQATAPFDWRTYRSPAGSDRATPPMVDA